MAFGDDPQNNPYAAPEGGVAPLSDVGSAKGFTGYAGFWLRFVAYWIDQFVLGAVFAVVGALVGLVFGIMGGVTAPSEPGQELQANPAMAMMMLILYGIMIVGYFAYYTVMESSRYQATLGKLALGLKVTDLQGRRLSGGRALGRALAKIVSNLTCMIGYVLAGFTERKQALHDMIAGTLVVKAPR